MRSSQRKKKVAQLFWSLGSDIIWHDAKSLSWWCTVQVYFPAHEKQSVKEKGFHDFVSFEVGLRIGEGLCVVVAGWVGGCCREEVAAEGCSRLGCTRLHTLLLLFSSPPPKPLPSLIRPLRPKYCSSRFKLSSNRTSLPPHWSTKNPMYF